MKTPDEIKKGLECCQYSEEMPTDCDHCPYYLKADPCDVQMQKDALAHIERLEGMAKPNEQIRWERDIAMRQLAEMGVGFGEKVSGQIPKWISVEEGLPEDGQRVVAIVKNGMTGIMDYKADGTPFAARIFGKYFSEVTHWMPLPELPED